MVSFSGHSLKKTGPIPISSSEAIVSRGSGGQQSMGTFLDFRLIVSGTGNE